MLSLHVKKLFSYITEAHLCVKPAAPGFIWKDISVHTQTVATKSLILFKSVQSKHVWGFGRQQMHRFKD